MGIEVLSQSTPIARKDYRCSAWEWIINWSIREAVEECKLFSEKRHLVNMYHRKGKILKGERYFRARIKQDGDLIDFIANIRTDEICRKYHWYVD